MTATPSRRYEEIKATGRLPSPRGVARAVLELTRDPDANIPAITRLVQSDPAMSARLLRYANAARGGSLNPIVSVQQAIIFLGLFRIRQVALGFSLIDDHRRGACASFDYTRYWTQSLATAVTARHVSHLAQVPPDESFTSGLLSGIGRLAFASVYPAEYDALLAQTQNDATLREAERARFGMDHAELGGELLAEWGLPEIFHQAVRYTEICDLAPFAPGSRAHALAAALALATRMGQLLAAESRRRWERVPALYQAAAALGLEEHDIPPLLQAVAAQWRLWGDELGLPTGGPKELAGIFHAPPEPSAELRGGLVVPLRVVVYARSASRMPAVVATLAATGLAADVTTDFDRTATLLQAGGVDVLFIECDACGEAAAGRVRVLKSMAGAHDVHCIALIPPAAEPDVARLLIAGASDYLVSNHAPVTLLARLHAAQQMVALRAAVRAERASLVRTSGEWARSHRRLLREALTDPLTGVANRRHGEDRLAQECSFSAHSGAPVSCLLLDVDHFKKVNDTHGHDIGDLVLKQVAGIVAGACRKTDVLFRLGGEEFCVVCPGADRAGAVVVAERILRAIRDARFGDLGAPFRATISIGVAERAPGASTPHALLAAADRALYDAKRGGRNQIVAAARPALPGPG
jgi:diguanylate cyclase (GGDEF)-like protein